MNQKTQRRKQKSIGRKNLKSTGKVIVPRKRRKTFFSKYDTVIILFIGSLIGFSIWCFFIRCGNIHCIRNSLVVPYVGISAFITWCIFMAFFKK
jgi:hypothetical protein